MLSLDQHEVEVVAELGLCTGPLAINHAAHVRRNGPVGGAKCIINNLTLLDSELNTGKGGHL